MSYGEVAKGYYQRHNAIHPYPVLGLGEFLLNLYANRPTGRRGQLVGLFATREAAWSAMTRVPAGFEVWVNDQPTSLPARTDRPTS